MILIAILLPFLSFFLRGKIFAGIICIILQLTIISWPIASIWAVLAYFRASQRKDMERLYKKMNQR